MGGILSKDESKPCDIKDSVNIINETDTFESMDQDLKSWANDVLINVLSIFLTITAIYLSLLSIIKSFFTIF